MAKKAERPFQIFQPHPILGWSLAPEAIIVPPFRNTITQVIGPDGWRKVPGQPAHPAATLIAYGCSFTFGTGLADEETYPALLQAEFADVRVLNRGVGGHGTAQIYLQFLDDVRNGRVDAALFGVMSHHRYRNMPHPSNMTQMMTPTWWELGVEHIPYAHLERDGGLTIKYVSIRQPCLLRNDFNDFLPDDYMLDEATICVLRAIEALAIENDIPILFVLLDQNVADFNARILQEFPRTLDVSTPRDTEHTFLPHDGHPNPLANQKFARRLLPQVKEMCAKLPSSSGPSPACSL